MAAPSPRPTYHGGPPTMSPRQQFTCYPPWSEKQVRSATRNDSGRQIDDALPHYQTRAMIQAGSGYTNMVDSRRSREGEMMHLRLHSTNTHAKHAKNLLPFEMSMSGSGPKSRPFEQPSLPSPRRPMSPRQPVNGFARPLPVNYPPFKQGLTPRSLLNMGSLLAAQEDEAKKAAEEARKNRIVKMVEEKKKTERKWGQLPEGVTMQMLQAAASAMKEKLVDKFGSLQKAFRAIDVDGSATVTKDELVRYLEIINLNTSMSKDVIDALFETIDADASGSFDFREFTRVMNSGDLQKMEAVKERFDGFQAKEDEEAAAKQRELEYEAKLVGMSVEDYQEYWKNLPKMQSSKDMAHVQRDRWGHRIKGTVLAYNT